jgi:hypothetical protein
MTGIGDYLLNEQVLDSCDPRYGLFTGGFGRWFNQDGNGLFFEDKIEWIAAEHNIDIYFFLRDLGQITGESRYTEAADLLKANLVKKLWNETKGRLDQGIGNPSYALDAASWGAIYLTAIGDLDKAKSSLDYADHANMNTITTNPVWSEGSLGVAIAYLHNDDMALTIKPPWRRHEVGHSVGIDKTFDVAWGDVDGDGDLDAVVGNEYDMGNDNQIWLNDGSGSGIYIKDRPALIQNNVIIGNQSTHNGGSVYLIDIHHGDSIIWGVYDNYGDLDNEDIVFIATESGVLRSGDGGQTWLSLDEAKGNEILNRPFYDLDIILTGNDSNFTQPTSTSINPYAPMDVPQLPTPTTAIPPSHSALGYNTNRLTKLLAIGQTALILLLFSTVTSVVRQKGKIKLAFRKPKVSE